MSRLTVVALSLPLLLACEPKSSTLATQEASPSPKTDASSPLPLEEPAPEAEPTVPSEAPEPAAAANEDEPVEPSLVPDLPSDPPAERDLLPFPEREFEGPPFKEEHLRTRVFWKAPKTRLTTCKEPRTTSRCTAHGPIVEPGDELEWKYAIVRVKPRLLTAKHEVEMSIHGQPMTLKAGTVVALYLYQGEGTCSIATGHLFDEATTCPLPQDFENYPPPAGTTFETLAPDSYTWWIERDEGWIRIQPEQVRIEFETITE
jgi:hypothetical protein